MRKTSFVSTRLFPKQSVKQTESESLNSLANALQEYISKVVEFPGENTSKARFKPAEEIQAS
jgi:hypothetical protein